MPLRAATEARPRGARTIGRYAIYGEIASGGMATVHFGRLAGDVGFSRPVAIKRLHPQFAKDPDFRAGFVDEALLVSRIRHQNVVPTLDVVADEDELFLVMEYVQGESLWRLMKAAHDRRVRVPPPIAIAIVSQVLHGLHAAHEARTESGEALEIVHRDVSPQNVLVGTDGAARVLDFGIALAAQRSEVTKGDRVKGKVSYMAPEQLGGSPATRQVDVYAAAVILWELLAGRRLFHKGNPQELLIDKLFREHVPPPSALNEHAPRAVDAVVAKGLARDPKDRHATARDMAIALEGCGKLATMSEVGAWVEKMAHDALEKRAREVADCESVSLPASQEIRTPATPSTSPFVASINPLSLPTPSQLPSLPPPLPRFAGTSSAPPPAKPMRERLRRSLASLLEPDLESQVLERIRLLAFERKRIALASVLAAGVFGVSVAAVRTIASHFGTEPGRVGAAVADRGAPDLLVEPLGACPDGMAAVPGGRFFMGSDDEHPTERPAHHVTLSPYCISVYEVTTEDYKACSERGDCRRPSATNDWNGIGATEKKAFDPLCNGRDGSGRGRHPINCVDWEMAAQYCSAQGARLPTEAEWEFAARGPDGRKYPWGDEAPSARLLNACGKECLEWGKRNHVEQSAMYGEGDGWPTTAPVGSFPGGRSRYGVHDLVGNVWEWVADYWGPYDAEAKDDPRGPASGRERVIRGGAWNGAIAEWVRPTFRYHDPPETKSYGIGFRCATDQGRYARDMRR